ncbi:hypothetical protein IWX90DRAFT_255406 [Phyllosticta citrichinensis]|uniref:Uncharacterized protein n=1 Tax=Phyllosticta citrichinensis TaxID=1130410 RepID=A0ABR1XRK3_9PEZI
MSDVEENRVELGRWKPLTPLAGLCAAHTLNTSFSLSLSPFLPLLPETIDLKSLPSHLTRLHRTNAPPSINLPPVHASVETFRVQGMPKLDTTLSFHPSTDRRLVGLAVPARNMGYTIRCTLHPIHPLLFLPLVSDAAVSLPASSGAGTNFARRRSQKTAAKAETGQFANCCSPPDRGVAFHLGALRHLNLVCARLLWRSISTALRQDAI